MNKITMSDLGEGELVSSELQDALVRIGVHFTYIGTGSTVVIENSRASDMLDNLEMTVKYSKNEEEVNQEFTTLAEDWKREYFRTEEPPLSDTNPLTIWKRNHQEAPLPTVSAAACLDAIKRHDRNAYANAVLAKVPQSDINLPDLATHIAIHEKLAEEAELRALLTEFPKLLQLVERPDLLWGDPVTKVQFIDTYERWIPAKPKEARDITISRALLCEGNFNEVDVELLEQEVSANYSPFEYEGEYLSAWGYEPATDEVTLRFLKGQS